MTALRVAMLLAAAAPMALACSHEAGSGSDKLSGKGEASTWPAGQVVCLEYLGPTDRPVPPVILAAKLADARAFVRANPEKQNLRWARQVAASREALDCAQSHLPGRAESAKDALLSVRVWREKSSHEARLDGGHGLKLLRALQRCLEQDSAEAASELNALITFIRTEMERRR